VSALAHAQRAAYRRDGFLVVPDAVTSAQLEALRAEFARWVEQSRAHAAPWGRPWTAARASTSSPGTRPSTRRRDA